MNITSKKTQIPKNQKDCAGQVSIGFIERNLAEKQLGDLQTFHHPIAWAKCGCSKARFPLKEHPWRSPHAYSNRKQLWDCRTVVAS
jgi:hypothetical protein